MYSHHKRTTVFGYLVTVPQDLPASIPFFPVPPSCVIGTNSGRQRYEQRQIDQIQVCKTYFTTATCANGATCADLHVDRQFTLNSLQSAVPCCRCHGDPYTTKLLDDVPELLIAVQPLVVNGVMISVDRMCVTAAVFRHRADAPAEVCAEHLKGLCSRSKDCPKLHVCRQMYGLAQMRGPMTQQGAQPMPAGHAVHHQHHSATRPPGAR